MIRQDFERVRDNERSECNVIRGVKEEDEGYDRMSSRSSPMLSILGEADCLRGVEQGHQSGRKQEEEPTTQTLDHEGGGHRPSQVPNLQNTIDGELCACTGDTDLVEDLTQVIRDETVTRPLREEGDGDDDVHTLAISRSSDERLPADIVSNRTVELDCGLDFLEFILHERV